MAELSRNQEAVSATVDGADEWTDWIYVRQLERASVSVTVSNDFDGTITLQRSFDKGVTPLDVETFTVSEEGTYRSDAGAMVRIGIKAGDYVDGEADVRIGKGG